jgi:16S rRNA (guanine1207-N2)-methyltransferase
VAHYFSNLPEVASRPGEVNLSVGELSVKLRSDRGVFASGRIDQGTLILLRQAPEPVGAADLLDLGCGYGPIAVTLAKRCPAATVWAVDVNERAVALTSFNAEALGLANLKAGLPSEVPDEVAFDEIWSNPPIRVGKAALHELLATWLPRLKPAGRAWLVVQRNLGADSLAGWLAAEGYEVRREASKQGYRVLQVLASR